MVAFVLPSLRPGQLFALRSAVVASLGLALVVNLQFLERSAASPMLAWACGALALFNLVAWWKGRHAAQASRAQIRLQVLADVAALTFFFYFAGGATHPFIDVYLLPAALAAVALPVRNGLAVGLLTIGCYLFLVKWHVSLPAVREGREGFHCFAMWLKYLLVGGFLAYLLYCVARRLREAEARSAARLSAQDEYLARAGSLAASAAHEMSAPLCTMSVVVNEILQEEDGPRARPALRLVAQQIEACRRLLGELMTYGQGMLGAPPEPRVLAADRFLHEIVERWRVLRPRASLAMERSGSEPAPAVPEPSGLAHAVLALLNNAADASSDAVEMRCTWSAAELRIEVLDRGPGLPPEVLASPGARCVSTKRGKGFGIGLVLARNVVERAGGRLELGPRPGGGTRAEIVVPLSPARAGEAGRSMASHGFAVRYHSVSP